MSCPAEPPLRSARRLGPIDATRLHGLLRRDPLRFALPLGWLESHGTLPTADGNRFDFVGCGADAVSGAALVVGRSLCFVAADNVTDAAAIAEFLLRHSVIPRVITGPRNTVAALAAQFRRAGVRVGVMQDQTVMALTSRALRFYPDPELVTASEADLADVLAESLAMHEDETGAPPSRAEVEAIDAATRSRIRAGRLWIHRDAVTGELLFKASVAAVAAKVAQLEGVWVPPAARGRGIARRGVSELCRRLLAEVEAVTLYVGDANTPAVRLYQRIGFATHGPWATLQVGTR